MRIKAKILIVVSQQDVAGLNMLQILRSKVEFEEKQLLTEKNWPAGSYTFFSSPNFSILLIPGDQIFTDYFEGSIDVELLIYASKHSAASGKKALLAHTTGVFSNDTSHGGKAATLSISPYNLISIAYEKIDRLKKEYGLDNYWTGIEVTHHGPSINLPILFLETGGTEEEWNDMLACRLIAQVALEIVGLVNNDKHRDISRSTAIGIGGTHYAASFIKQMDKQVFYIGHIIPKYAHDLVPDSIIKELWEKTIGERKLFLIDKKGCNGKNRNRFIQIIEKNGYPWQYT